MMPHPSVVFIGNQQSVFVARTAEELRKRGILVTIVDTRAASSINGRGPLSKVARVLERYVRLSRVIRSLPPHDAAIIHFLRKDVFFQARAARKIAPRVIGLAYGSDILRRDKRFDWLLARGLHSLTKVAATNTNVVDEIIRSFPGLGGCRVIRFGLPVLDALDVLDARREETLLIRKQLSLPADKTIVSLGYSATRGQRQLELLSFFRQHAQQLAHLRFVVPVQYGSNDVAAEVVEACDRHNRELGEPIFLPLREFLDAERSALLRMATDVLINHSISDAFSGTVQEVLYAGNCVLASSGLPYDNMPGGKVGIVQYGTLEDMLVRLDAASLATWKERVTASKQQTKAAIAATSSWNAVLDDWRRLITDGVQMQAERPKA